MSGDVSVDNPMGHLSKLDASLARFGPRRLSKLHFAAGPGDTRDVIALISDAIASVLFVPNRHWSSPIVPNPRSTGVSDGEESGEVDARLTSLPPEWASMRSFVPVRHKRYVEVWGRMIDAALGERGT